MPSLSHCLMVLWPVTGASQKLVWVDPGKLQLEVHPLWGVEENNFTANADGEVTTKPFLHFSKTIRNDKKVEEWKRIRTWKDSNLHRTDFQTTAPHRATGTDDILCTFCQLWIRINRSCDVCTVSVDIIQPIYLGKETSNQLGFCPNWGACVAACKWQLCSCGPLQYFFGPPNIVFSWGGRLPPPLVCKWFNGGCDRLCWAMSKIRSLQTSPLHTRAGKQWLTKPLKHLAHHSFKRGPNGGFFSCLDEHRSPVVLSEQIEIMWKRMINQGMRLRQKSSPKDQIGWSPVGPWFSVQVGLIWVTSYDLRRKYHDAAAHAGWASANSLIAWGGLSPWGATWGYFYIRLMGEPGSKMRHLQGVWRAFAPVHEEWELDKFG